MLKLVGQTMEKREFLHNVEVTPQKILTNGKGKKCQCHKRQRKIEKLSQIKETKETTKRIV